MDVNIKIEQGRCHDCGHEYVVLSHKVEHPKELKVPSVARCPECGTENPITFSGRKQLIEIPIDNLGKLSEILLQDVKCAKCGRPLSLLSGERVDLVFKMEKVLNEADGLVEKWTRSVPFCRHCKELASDNELLIASRKYFEAEKDISPAELLNNATRSWKY
jgi:ribosomal protein S27E